MKVTVKLSEPLWRTVGQRKLSLELGDGARTVADVLDRLDQCYPGFKAELSGQTGDLIPYSLFLGSNRVPLNEADRAEVKDGDELMILLPIAGG